MSMETHEGKQGERKGDICRYDRGEGIEEWEIIYAFSATEEVGEGSYPLNSWPVNGPYGQSGELRWAVGGDFGPTLEKPCLLGASRELPDGPWIEPKFLARAIPIQKPAPDRVPAQKMGIWSRLWRKFSTAEGPGGGQK